MFLTLQGHVFTCGNNAHGQLGLGDTVDRATPTNIELFEGLGKVVQIAAGASYTFAVSDDGTVYSFGSCTNFCLGHGDQHDQLAPRTIESFKRRNLHILRVSAGDEHAVALDSSGYVCLISVICSFELISSDCSKVLNISQYLWTSGPICTRWYWSILVYSTNLYQC